MIQATRRFLQELFFFYFPDIEAKRLEQRFRQRISLLFQVDNTVVDRATGEVYKVREVDCGGAMLEARSGVVCMLSWVLPSGKPKVQLAEKFELIQAN